jgi:exosortase
MTAPAHIMSSSAERDVQSSNVAALAALLLLVVGYSPTLMAFPGAWLDFRAHGFVIAAFCLWLIWSSRTGFVPEMVDPIPARLAAVLCSLLWLLAVVAGTRVIHMTALPLAVLAWTAAVFGVPTMQRMLPVALIFTLAIPVWEVFVDLLQAMTVAVNGVLVGILQLKATLTGNQIVFPFGTVEVAQSCAGLNYLMSGLTISVLFAQLFLRSRAAKVATITVGVVLSIVSNWIRVFGLVLIGYNTRMTSPLMEEHGTYGWVIFAVVSGVFFFIAGRIDRWDHAQPALQPLAVPAVRATVSVSAFRSNLVLGTAAVLVGPLLLLALTARPGVQEAAGALRGVQPDTQWTLAPVDVGAERDTATDSSSTGRWRPAYRGASRQQLLTWSNGTTEIQVNRLLYLLQDQQGELIGGGNQIAPRQRLLSERMVGPLDDQFRTVLEAVVRTPTGARLVWYWYRVANVDTPSAAKAKLLELVTFVTRGAPSELVAVSAACGVDNCQEAGRAIYDFVTGQPTPERRAP